MKEPAKLCDPADLAEGMRRGDPEVLEALTRCYGERLLAVGLRYCRTCEEARDAVQDAWLAASTHLEDFRGEGSPEGWLVRIVANACRRMRRGGKNDPTRHDDVSEVALADPGPDPAARADRGLLMAALGDALLELSPLDRAIFLLAEAEGWTSPEIAERLDLTPNAVRIRLSRVRGRLRPRLAPYLDRM